MSGIDDPGTPPEVPEEYAAVYRDAYERALVEEAGESGLAADLLGPGTEPSWSPSARPAWAVPVAVIGGVLVLVLCAFGLGRLLSSADNGTAAGAPASPGTRIPASPTPTPTPSHKPSPSTPTKTAGASWTGAIEPVAVDAVTTGCTAAPGVDSSGHPVRYVADNTVDGDPSTAWRCDGTAVGTVLTLTLPAGTPVAEVGLIPGYAKTDPKSGADRYAENNRITKVRWTLADGVQIVQTLDPDPKNREVQTLRVPRTATGTVTVQILAVDRGARNTTAISEIVVARAR